MTKTFGGCIVSLPRWKHRSGRVGRHHRREGGRGERGVQTIVDMRRIHYLLVVSDDIMELRDNLGFERNLCTRGQHSYCLVRYTVEPPNKGHFGANSFVACREVVPISEVK